jgi:hypothetical protein
VVFFGKDLLCPSGNATADKKKSCNTYSNARHKTCEAECDAEREKKGPRSTCRHFDGLSLILFCSAVTHYKSPSDQVNDCKHHDPHCIHKVPIEGDNSEAFTLPRVNPTEQREDEDRGKKRQPDYDVGRV